MKFCNKCRKKLPKSEFNARKASYDGLAPICRPCEKERCAEQYQKRKMKSLP